MLRRTYTAELGFMNAGEIMETDDKTADRWIKKGLAVDVSVEVEKPKKKAKKPEAPQEDFGTFTEDDSVMPDTRTYADLLDTAHAIGIDVHGRPKKADLIAMIEEGIEE
jgi:hypothetical protein